MYRTTSKSKISTYQQLINSPTRIHKPIPQARFLYREKQNINDGKMKIDLTQFLIRGKQSKLKQGFGQDMDPQVMGKQGRFKIDWKINCGKINRRRSIIYDTENSITSLSISDLPTSSAQLNPQDIDSPQKSQKDCNCPLHNLTQTRFQTSLGQIILQRQSQEQQSSVKLVLNYYRLASFVKYVEFTCQAIDVRQSASCPGTIYQVGDRDLVDPIKDLYHYCLQIVKIIADIQTQSVHSISPQINKQSSDQDQNNQDNNFKHEYLFTFEDKKINLSISQQGEAIISISQHPNKTYLNPKQLSSFSKHKQKLMQIYKFTNLSDLQKQNNRSQLASVLGESLLMKIMKIYANYWFLYVCDL